MNKKLVEIMLAVLLGLAGGVFVSSVLGELKNIGLFSLLFSFLFDKKIMLLLLLVLVLFLLYFRRADVEFYLPFRKIINTIVYLHVVTLFLSWEEEPFIPFLGAWRVTFLLFFCLLMVVSLLSLLKKSKNNTPISFKLLAFWFIFSSVAGIITGMMGFNSVRANISLVRQFSGLLFFADALLIYYVVVKNGWGFREFEKLSRIILIGGLIISIESVIVFYPDLLPQLKLVSVNNYGHFSSMFIGRHHYPGVIGIFMVFLSLYFWSKYGRRKYLISFVLGLLLALSSLSRSAIWSMGFGIIFFAFLTLRYSYFSHRASWLKASFFVISVMLIPVIAFLLLLVIKMRQTDTSLYFSSGLSRLGTYSRTIDVFYDKFILGTGVGLSPYYLHSAYVPQVFSGGTNLPKEQSFGYYRGIVAEPTLEIITTVHNLPLQFIVELGIGGLIFAIFLMCRGIKIFFYIFSFAKKTKGNYPLLPIFAILSLNLSTFMVVQTTSKFESYWYFGILFGFINSIYVHLKKHLSRTV